MRRDQRMSATTNDYVDLPPALGEWLQTTLAKGQGARVIALLQAIEDWMQVCHQQESEIERLEAALERIASAPSLWLPDGPVRRIARAALAACPEVLECQTKGRDE